MNENEKYEREDSETGFATKNSEIALLKASRKYDVIANELLGNYDKDGHYTISNEILNELARLKKFVGVTNEFGTELKAPYKDGRTFNFILKIGKEDPETHKAESVLYLMETINKVNGYIQNVLTTPVATYSYKYDEHYKDYCYRALFIVTNGEDDSDGSFNGDAPNINKRFEYLNAVKKASKDQYLVLEESFFNARIQILNELPQGALVLSEFNKKRSALEKYFINNPRNKFRALNELLTSILESYFDSLEDTPAYKIAIQILIMKYLNQVMQISTQIKETEDYKRAKEAVQVVPSGPAPAGKPVKGSVKIAGKKPAPKPKKNDKVKGLKAPKYEKMGKLNPYGIKGGGSSSSGSKQKNSTKGENLDKTMKLTEKKEKTPKEKKSPNIQTKKAIRRAPQKSIEF